MMYEVKLDVFNGPLDLLLHLIQKYEIDIYDIPMKTLTDQYMQYIHTMTDLEINVASEYLVVASELLMIKSKMLLPQVPDEDDIIDDPRDELVGRLLEYQNYKAYTEFLLDKMDARSHYYAKHPTDLSHLEVATTWDSENHIDLTELLIAYQRIKNRVAFNTPKSVEIHKETFTIQEASSAVSERLSKQPSFNFFSLFNFNASLEMVVTHFLAILELSKSGIVNIKQLEQFEDIEIVRGVNYGTN